MRGRFETFKIVALIAFRNLFASRLKTIIVGGIIFFGALIVVLGSSFVESLIGAMSRSVIGSVAGHIQVHSADAKDPLEVTGGFDLEGGNIGQLDDFAKLKQVLLSVPDVQAVVPMGISGALVTSGNTIDVALGRLREAVRKKQNGDTSEETLAVASGEKAHVRQMVRVLAGDIANVSKILDERVLGADAIAAVKTAAEDTFWTDFDKDPLTSLEFLENRIAPLATDADFLFLRYVGTDPDAFAQSFDRMRIVDGTKIPRGQRGFLFAKYTYEEQVKLRTARRLDKIRQAVEERGKKIAADDELKAFVRENKTQVREIVLQLDDRKTEQYRKKLQQFLKTSETDVAKLLSQFLDTSDDTFRERYAFFYKELAPSLELYRVRIGDTLTIKAFTRTGYVQSLNVKIYGTFDFEGLEDSPYAGALSIMDLVSFRELYGFMTDERKAEIAALKKHAGARVITRSNAEAELFGGASETAETAAAADASEADEAERALASLGGRKDREARRASSYDPKQLEEGVVLNAAIILKDPKRLDAAMAAVEAAGKSAGLNLKVISWQDAAGFLGQLVNTGRLVLMVAVLIIFVVALVIINNALVMATLERVREIGTLRAVGAQRRFVLSMLVIEALVVGLVFGGAGVAVGAIIIGVLGVVGIPAPSQTWTFFFSGPRLHPTLGTTNLVVALAIVLVVSALSSLYPAWIAVRVTPRQAMQTED